MLRSEAAVRVPSHVNAAKYAPILCAGVTVFNSMRNMNVPPGATVAIQGLGGLGHLAVQYANKFGYRVVVLSRDSKKEKFARDLGADEYIDASKGDTGEALQKLGGASLIVATAPSADAITPLLKGLGIFGKLLILSSKDASGALLFGVHGMAKTCNLVPGTIPVDTAAMVRLLSSGVHDSPKLTLEQIRYGLSVQSWPSGHATDSEEAIEFTEVKNVDCMVEKFPLAKANDAFSRCL